MKTCKLFLKMFLTVFKSLCPGIYAYITGLKNLFHIFKKLICKQVLFLWYDITNTHIHKCLCEVLKKNAYFLYGGKSQGKFRTH